MFKLVYFKAVNLIGFQSGLGKKTFELDLEDFLDKEIICVIGDNGTGKSTFLSLVHPWNTPADGRTKFVIPGKEGTLIRKYASDDGSEMISKCIYKPKKDGGHTSSCYLEKVFPDGSRTELNPNGNVSSYQSLLYTYFGISKDYLSFASYSTAAASIVRMTDTERKSAVGSLVPNTKRFEVAFDIVNEKWKNLRNQIRNISQKILSLRDEESLQADLNRMTDEMIRYTSAREDAIRKQAKLEGRLKELTGGKDPGEIISSYNEKIGNLARFDTDLERVYKRLMKIYEELGIEPKEGSISFEGIEKVPNFIMKYERKLARNESEHAGYVKSQENLQGELHKTENQINETGSLLYSIQSQDIKELEKTRKNLLEELDSMEYSGMKDELEGMSYEGLTSFSRNVVMLDSMIQALYDEYGQQVSVYFSQENRDLYTRGNAEQAEVLHGELLSLSAKRDQIYRELLEKNQYLALRETLNRRPAECRIDTCPFIAAALKYAGIADEIDALKKQYADMGIEISAREKNLSQLENCVSLHNDAQKIVQFVQGNMEQLKIYLGVKDERILYQSIADGRWSDVLDMMKLKRLAAILSEKSRYLQIENMLLPEVERSIELAKAYGVNRDLLTSQMGMLQERRDDIISQLQEIQMHLAISEQQHDRYEEKLRLWKEASENIERYRDLVSKQIQLQDEAAEQSERIRKISEYREKCRDIRNTIDELDDLIRDRTPMREQVKMDLDAVRRLKIDKAAVEQDYIVIEVIRSIVSPGKGIRKELIDIYMYDIYQIANQLLLNTFDGKLYLKRFIITDKEFIIPYVYNGTESPDIYCASSAQQSAIASALSLAILSKLVDKYGVYTGDEQDSALNPKNKGIFIDILTKQMRYVGIRQAFIITQEPSYYEPYDPGFIVFPGGELRGKNHDIIRVDA